MKITQNQYINKPKYMSNKNKIENITNLTSTCDISSGYLQAKNLMMFRGVSEEVECGCDSKFEYSYFLLSNPKDSNINILMQNSIITNYSCHPISSRIYYCVEDFYGNLECSKNITITNSNSSGKMPRGKLYFGNDLEKIFGSYCQNLIISPHDMHMCRENGSVIISPGYCYLFEISPLDSSSTSSLIMSFSWWEEPISGLLD